MSNLPPGVRETDLPGFNDVDIVIDVTCPSCEVKSEGTDQTVDSKAHILYLTCPACDWEWEQAVDYEGDVEAYEQAKRDREEDYYDYYH